MNPQKLAAEPATLATPVAQIQINAHGAFVAACSPVPGHRYPPRVQRRDGRGAGSRNNPAAGAR